MLSRSETGDSASRHSVDTTLPGCLKIALVNPLGFSEERLKHGELNEKASTSLRTSLVEAKGHQQGHKVGGPANCYVIQSCGQGQ